MHSTSRSTARGPDQEIWGEGSQRPSRRSHRQLDEMFDRLNALVRDGLNHGFFEYAIKCEIGTGGRRQVLIQAGKSHKFNIPEDEVSS
jgi:hypothetical protein